MARGGSKKFREQKQSGPFPRAQYSQDQWIERQNELVGELWQYDALVSTRNRILQRLTDHLTPEEKLELAR